MKADFRKCRGHSGSEPGNGGAITGTRRHSEADHARAGIADLFTLVEVAARVGCLIAGIQRARIAITARIRRMPARAGRWRR